MQSLWRSVHSEFLDVGVGTKVLDQRSIYGELPEVSTAYASTDMTWSSVKPVLSESLQTNE